jgi:hypothetical protein
MFFFYLSFVLFVPLVVNLFALLNPASAQQPRTNYTVPVHQPP